MFAKNGKVSLRQLKLLIISDIFGVAAMFIPVYLSGNKDSWLIVPGAGIFILIFSWFMNKLSFAMQGRGFSRHTCYACGSLLGTVIYFGLGLKIIIVTGLILRVFSEAIKQTMLPNANVSLIAFVMLLLSAFGAFSGYESRARTSELLFVFMFVIFVFMMVLTSASADFSNLKPIVFPEISEYIVLSFKTSFAFFGLEYIYLAGPYIANPERAPKEITKALMILTIAITLIMVLVLAKFGVNESGYKLWPVLQLMDTVDFPGAFLERQDIFITGLYIVSVFAAVNAGVFFSHMLFSDVIKKSRISLGFVLISIFIVSLLPNDITESYFWLQKSSFIGGIIYILIVPLTLLLITKLKRGWR